MTDPHDPLDDLLSAHLDGATTAEEAALLAADPAAPARLAELERVQAAVRAATPVDPEARERAMAAALAAFDDSAAATVTPLAPAAARRASSARARRVLGWAAAVALLVALVPLLGQLASSSDDDDSASSADETSEALDADDQTGGAGAADAGDGSEVVPSTSVGAEAPATEASPIGSLGTFDDVETLLAAVRATTPDTDTSFRAADEPVAALTPCVVQQLPKPTDLQSVRVAQAVVAGDAVTVVESGPPDAPLITVVQEVPSCTLLAQELR